MRQLESRVALIAPFILLVTIFGSGQAQTKLEARLTNEGYVVDNPLPIPIVASVVARDGNGNILSYATIIVPANFSQSVGKLQGPDARVEDFEIVHLGAPRNNLPLVGDRRDASVQLDPNAVKQQLKRLEISESGIGNQKLALATEAAELWLEQRRDERDAYRNDPLRSEIQRQAMALDRTQNDFLRRQQVQNERQRNELIEDVGDMALAYSMADEAKREVLLQEKDLYEPLYKNAKSALVFLHQDMKNALAELQVGRDFLDNAFQSLRGLPPNESIASEVSVSSRPRRVRTDVPGLKDLVEVEATGPISLAVLLAETRFDRGGSQKTFFRRIGKSNRWVARIYWPLSATQAEFRIMVPGQTQWTPSIGSVQAGRPSLEDSFQRAEKSMNNVIKKYKETTFRSEGADNIKTIPIP